MEIIVFLSIVIAVGAVYDGTVVYDYVNGIDVYS